MDTNTEAAALRVQAFLDANRLGGPREKIYCIDDEQLLDSDLQALVDAVVKSKAEVFKPNPGDAILIRCSDELYEVYWNQMQRLFPGNATICIDLDERISAEPLERQVERHVEELHRLIGHAFRHPAR